MKPRRSKVIVAALAAGLLMLLSTGCTAQVPQPDPSSASRADPNCHTITSPEADIDEDWYAQYLDIAALPTDVATNGPLEEHSSVEVDGQTFYFLKTGLPVYGGAVVTISSVDGTALVDWLGEGLQTSQTVGPCGPPDAWFVYSPGGFYVREPGCYEFLIESRRETVTAQIAVAAEC